MKRHEAEKVLGGYAAGILTEAEQRALFAAALADQAVFDALVDEETLRDLLADPEARRRILDALAPVPRLWRRPAFIGLAASLFVLAVTSLVVLRHPETQAFRSAGPVDDRRPVQAPKPGTPTEAPAPAVSLPAKAKPARPGKVEPSPVAPVPEPVEAFADKAELQAVPPPPAPALAGAAPRLAKATRPPGNAERAREPFETRLERLPDGRARLEVLWRQEGHLYALKRSVDRTVVLAGQDLARPGSRAAVFEFALDPQDLVDVYLLAAPAEDPAALPAQGPVDGTRRRVFPE
ncbi:MAG TPA: hypothetical protein VN436_05420 [Holophaga sp.]|nr:hypothetical protein [Holophaga sp.]